MKEEVLFSETQRFKQWWLWIILVGVSAVLFYSFFKQLIHGEPQGKQPMSDGWLVLSTAIIISVLGFVMSMKLQTRITNNGIAVRFFPFHATFKMYPWTALNKVFVRQYNPIREYGGWGYRLGIFGHGMALNVSGDKGLQLEFKTGKRLLIGTCRAEEVQQILQQLLQVKM